MNFEKRYNELLPLVKEFVLSSRNTDPSLVQASATTRMSATLGMDQLLTKWGEVPAQP